MEFLISFICGALGMGCSPTIRSERTNAKAEGRELIPSTRELILFSFLFLHKTKIWSRK